MAVQGVSSMQVFSLFTTVTQVHVRNLFEAFFVPIELF